MNTEDTLDRLPTLMTVDELKHLMRVDRNTVYEAIARGQIPGVVRLGRTIRITRSTVVEWLRQGGGSRTERTTR